MNYGISFNFDLKSGQWIFNKVLIPINDCVFISIIKMLKAQEKESSKSGIIVKTPNKSFFIKIFFIFFK